MKGPLPGHGLANEGAAYAVAGCELPDGGVVHSHRLPVGTREGHARCSCGVFSGHLPSGGQRKKWHRDHKADVAAKGKS